MDDCITRLIEKRKPLVLGHCKTNGQIYSLSEAQLREFAEWAYAAGRQAGAAAAMRTADRKLELERARA